MNASSWSDLHRRATVVDIHAHPSLKQSLFRRSLTRRFRFIPAFFWPLTVRASIPLLQQGGVDLVFSAVYAPEKRLFEDIKQLKLLRYLPLPTAQRTWKKYIEPPYFNVIQTLLDEMEKQITRSARDSRQRRVVLVRSVGELNRVLEQGSQGPMAFIHTVEGGHALEGNSDDEILRNLESLYARGVAMITLGHFYPNRLVMPVMGFPEAMLLLLSPGRVKKLWADLDLTKGLTRTGEKVVERMIDLGMLIDISHCTPVARRDIYQIVEARATRPCVVASHVGSYEINPQPYNLEDWEVRWIADQGGMVGVIFMNYWLMPFPTLLGLHYVGRTIDQFVRAAGGRTEHVALGTDLDGFTDPPDDLKDASELPRVTELLFAEGRGETERKYTDGDIENILGQNAVRVLRAGWGKQA